MGIRAAREGDADIGMPSRPLRAEEKGLHEIVIGWDGIVPIVHPANPVKDITLAQFREVFAGRLTNWADPIDLSSWSPASRGRGPGERLRTW